MPKHYAIEKRHQILKRDTHALKSLRKQREFAKEIGEDKMSATLGSMGLLEQKLLKRIKTAQRMIGG